ncbi:MAG TPA: translation initiation factor IF-2 [Chthoniobacterales bacterium]
MAAKITTGKNEPYPSSRAKKPAFSPKPGAVPSTPAASEKPSDAPPAPKAPVEAVSLIEPKKKIRRADLGDSGFKKPFLPTIGPVAPKVEPEPPKAAAPAPTPAPAPAPVVEDLISGKPKPAPVVEPKVEEPEAEVESAKIIHIKPPIIVRELAEALGIKAFELIRELMALNIFPSINQSIEPDIAARICEKYGFIFEKERREKGAGIHRQEVVIVAPKAPEKPKEEELSLRPPVITMMGHVDHGKTSLLDAIRKARVAAGEAGGITQHIGAYSVERDGQKITFLDTPGHAAFTAMRARGANVTDIVVLVVAADDGLMPQSIEAINHAKAAGATIMVAINKIDLPSANPDRVKQQLQERDLTPEDWGGTTVICPVSATKGTGVPELLDMIHLQAEVLELKASSQADPRAIVIEAQVEAGRGPTATAIVKMGTLKVGQAFICGNYWGKVKQLINDLGKPIKEAGPSTPIKVLGFTGLPNAGDELVVMDSERSARMLSEERLDALRTEKLAVPQRATLESLFATIAGEQKKTLRVVLKSDVQGSMEALRGALEDIPSDKVDLNVIHAAVGPISESDVLLASASNAVILGFSVKVENNASATAKREGVQIKLYSIIYELLDQVREAMAGLLDPELRETVIGHAEVKQVFDLTKGKVAGCQVTDGRILRTGRARLLRRRQPIYDGGLGTLRRFQDDVKEVRNGLECGIKLGDFSEYEVGDIIECYTLDKVPQTL